MPTHLDLLGGFAVAGKQVVAKGFGADIVAELGDDLPEGVVALVSDIDPVHQVEIRLLAHLLDVADEVTAEPLALEFRGEGDI